MTTPHLDTPQGWPAPSSGPAADPYGVAVGDRGPSAYAPPYVSASAAAGASPAPAQGAWPAYVSASASSSVPGASSPSGPGAGAPPSPYAIQPGPEQPGAARRPGGLAIAALALGCVAVVLLGVQTGLVSAVLAVVGLVLGVVGLTSGPRPGTGGRGVGVTGVSVSAVAAVLAGGVFLVSGTPVGQQIASQLAWFTGSSVQLPLLNLRPGESAPVGDYTVTVDDIQMDADEALAADPRNAPAEGRYIQVVVTVQYEGAAFGVPEQDLLVSYAGSTDDWFYDEWGCAAITDRPVYDVGRLAPGQEATFVSCIDVPSGVVDQTAVIVEDLTSLDFTAEMWGVR